MTRRRATLSITPPAPVDDTPPEFCLVVRTGHVPDGQAAVLNSGILTVRADSSLASQLSFVEDAIKVLTDRPNRAQPQHRPAAVTR